MLSARRTATGPVGSTTTSAASYLTLPVRSIDAEGGPAVNILGLDHAHEIEQAKSGRDQKPEPAKSLFRLGRQPRIGKDYRDATRVRLGDKIRPNFSFDKNNSCRTHDSEGAPHDRPKIERIVYHFHPRRRGLIRERETGGCRGREHARQIRLQGAQLSGQLKRDSYFADADRVEPGRPVIGEARAQTDVIDSEALPEFFPISAAPKHLPQVAGKKNQQAQRPEEIIN